MNVVSVRWNFCECMVGDLCMMSGNGVEWRVYMNVWWVYGKLGKLNILKNWILVFNCCKVLGLGENIEVLK